MDHGTLIALVSAIIIPATVGLLGAGYAWGVLLSRIGGVEKRLQTHLERIHKRQNDAHDKLEELNLSVQGHHHRLQLLEGKKAG